MVQLYKNKTSSVQVMDWDRLKQRLPRRQRIAYKNRFGHVLVIGGDYGMGGAVRMAAEAALRVGAGLVTVATRPEHVSVVNTSRPELMCHEVTQSSDLLPLLSQATVIIIGPGLGQSDWARQLLEAVIDLTQPKVVDADALNLLSQSTQQSSNWVLTPHVGEAARLLQTSAAVIQENRVQAIVDIQKKYHGVVALKGAGTLVFDGVDPPSECSSGNPGMASGGMGDVLSGVIGGLLAQGLLLREAAEVGVMVHAKAGDFAAEKGGERGLLATDLMQYLRHLVNPDLTSDE